MCGIAGYIGKRIIDELIINQTLDLMKKRGFKKCFYRNLSGGIVSIHSGWKI